MTSMTTRVRLYLALLWWQLCQWVVRFVYVNSLAPSSQFFHKVVIIGDDFAAGLGDYVTMTSSAGLARHLKGVIAGNDKVRHRWEIINAGIPGSFSQDWLLNAPTKYFESVFSSNKRTSDAEIVIVMLGSNESRAKSGENAKEISRNLMSICDTLRKKGKHVCLATVASSTPLEPTVEKIPLNSMLEDFCASTKGDDMPVILGPRLDTYAFRRDNVLSFDGYHFNSSAYKLLARNTADFLVPMMTAVEWRTWKDQLQKVTYDKSLYE
ncbi:hypothetical protein Poli38472_000625 [Pythium oligandrum]|uniref:SGNH hydrolase-type esterase domain-containing protein n=1 Tax=Pythium oligandrum TaxID=41045 RepID=A0A8K1FJB3_PYTOL|nr:hypothetical protein Poli38472_000625 [Pythium oligandrum]|eukprot:TMW60583.1 hypothetical protein Poli38472_000625 [Pythium oligandrum]